MNAFDDIIRDALISMRDEGLSRKEAAARIGVSYQTLVTRLNRLGVEWPNAKWARTVRAGWEARQATILARHENGELHTSIATDYGISRERVRQIVAAAGGKPRHVQKDEQFVAIVDAVAAAPADLSARELAEHTGLNYDTIRAAAAAAGKSLPRRDSETTARLRELSKRVEAGQSFNAAADGDHALGSLLARFCEENGIKSMAPCRWTVDPEMRRRVIAEMRLAGAKWDDIAAVVTSNEGVRKIGVATLWNWTAKHAPDLLEIKPPKMPKPPRRAYPKARKPVKAPRVPVVEVEVKEDVRETAIANYGKAPASAIAKAVGVTRNSIIGYWHRARLSGEIAA